MTPPARGFFRIQKFRDIIFKKLFTWSFMSDKICPRCGSCKVFPYMPGYYICPSAECGNHLLEETEITINVVEVSEVTVQGNETTDQIEGLLSLP